MPRPRDETGDAFQTWERYVSSLRVDAIRRITVSLELGLDAAGLLFLPILALAPHGIAPLASITGVLALALGVLNGTERQRCFQAPAALLGTLLVWATLSATWSVDPAHSLLIAARVGGLPLIPITLRFGCGLILAARRNLKENAS